MKYIDEKYLDSEISKLPQSLRDNVVLNRPKIQTKQSNFHTYIQSQPIQQLEKQFHSKCIKNKEYYTRFPTTYSHGLKCYIFKKGTNIYKAHTGFLKIGGEEKYYNTEDQTKPSWFTNKYTAYGLCRHSWCGLTSYKLTKDLLLIDWYNPKNLKVIDNLLKKIDNKSLSKELRNHLGLQTGFNIPLHKQIEQLTSLYGWTSIWLYTKPQYVSNTWNGCDVVFIDGLSPMTAFKNVQKLAISLFKYLISSLSDIDGVYRSEIFSPLEEDGMTYISEILISIKKQQEFIIRDTSDPLDWTNWKIKGVKIDKHLGFMSKEIQINKAKYYGSYLRKNAEFALVKFYFNNKPKRIPHLKSTYIMSYNVHSFSNINSDISRSKNINNILSLITDLSPHLSHVVLQEVYFQTTKEENYFDQQMKENGFSFKICAINGVIKNTSIPNTSIKRHHLCVYLKDKIQNYKIIDVTNHKYLRNIIIFNHNNLTICAVHLEIATRLKKSFYISDEQNESNIQTLINKNSHIRKKQLKSIIQNDVDMIIGDCNFIPQDEETTFLQENGFSLNTTENTKTTPYNRVDLCFLKPQSMKNISYKSTHVLSVNYSDHLPILQELKFK